MVLDARPADPTPDAAVKGAVATAMAAIDEIAHAAAGETGASASYLADYPAAALQAARAGRRLNRTELRTCSRSGQEAALQGVGLATLVDLYLSATWRLWDTIGTASTGVAQPTLTALATYLFRAADDATSALTRGHQLAQRRVMRREEAAHREFLDGLLSGRVDGPDVRDRAARFGFHTGGVHVVAVATGDGELHPSVGAQLESLAVVQFGYDDVLVGTRDGQLVVVLPGHASDAGDTVFELLARVEPTPWRVGVGSHHAGPRGVSRSYREARAALDLASRAGLAEPVVDHRRLVPLRVISQDQQLVTELTELVLGGLASARGGPEPLIATLEAFFAENLNVSATARALHVTPRGLVHRLETIRRLTGYDPRDAEDRFTLELATRATRLHGTSGSP